MTRQLTELVAERTDAERDTAPRLMADVVSAALRTPVEKWATGDTDVSLPDLIRESLTQLGAGLPIVGVAPASQPSPLSTPPPAGWPDDSIRPR
ncbi:hypothetical protein [Streptomyces sp. NPDC048581]|uniref:acyl-CoA-like ligand-binding transcription factor n=1 Tax=unclassified Streptomyces TaxID=2593676 RepID=UPI0037133BFC